MDASKLQRAIPHLNDYGKDVDSWMEEFTRIMEIFNVDEPRRIFIWAKEAVDCDIKEVLNSLLVRKNNEIRYPKYKEIQTAIEEYLEITPNDKCSNLKTMRIKNTETIKNFNYRYLKLYHRLERDYMKLVSVDDYLNAIKIRKYPHSQVIISECETLTEAFKVAERAEKAERKTMNEDPYPNNSYNVNMMTQNQVYSSLMNHPIYSGMMNRNVTYFDNSYIPKYDNNNNNQGNSGNYDNFNRNNSSRQFNNYDNNNGFNLPDNFNPVYKPNNVSQIGFLNQPQKFTSYRYGKINEYNSGYNNYPTNNGNINSNSLPNTSMIIQTKNNYGKLNSNFNSNYGNFSYGLSKNGNINPKQIYNNYDNNYYFKNNNNKRNNNSNSNTNVNNRSTPKKQDNIICFRCQQTGHKAIICPYSMDEIKKMHNENNNIDSKSTTHLNSE